MEAESSLKRPRRDGWRLRHVLCMSLTARAVFKSAENIKSPDLLADHPLRGGSSRSDLLRHPLLCGVSCLRMQFSKT